MGLKINLDNRTEFVPNLIATSKVQLDCQDPVAIAPSSVFVDLRRQRSCSRAHPRLTMLALLLSAHPPLSFNQHPRAQGTQQGQNHGYSHDPPKAVDKRFTNRLL